MPRLRRFGSAKAETDLREANWQAGQHGVAELGWKTALFHQLAASELGQERRKRRTVPSRLRMGWQRVKAGVRSRFQRAQTGSCSPHVLWRKKYGEWPQADGID